MAGKVWALGSIPKRIPQAGAAPYLSATALEIEKAFTSLIDMGVELIVFFPECIGRILLSRYHQRGVRSADFPDRNYLAYCNNNLLFIFILNLIILYQSRIKSKFTAV